MISMKRYETIMRKYAPKGKSENSGINCSENRCDGEMLIAIPNNPHPELTGLYRSKCSECGWLGWVPKP